MVAAVNAGEYRIARARANVRARPRLVHDWLDLAWRAASRLSSGDEEGPTNGDKDPFLAGSVIRGYEVLTSGEKKESHSC